ncbi:xylulokinase [Aliiruegeria sabulilitoris]|uniref:xylulokinase n=1 Tax=Aliiruegeria sabulilitoris TaxID=1510458 RepID=UPI00082E1A16|nr:FGGY family carbohydrate kinase [Aliiruegeria sabulilitoris]NDR56302.1 pentose kinase [Pseudoruegeria sp. M32A2M]
MADPVPTPASPGFVLAYDFGTGGCKSSIYAQDGHCLAEHFCGYETHFPAPGYHEQSPQDWWAAVKDSTRILLAKLPKETVHAIKAIGISGHSLAMVPLDGDGKPLLDRVPIWSDARPQQRELSVLFDKVDEEDWYLLTGNGFPAQLYTVFKILWLKHNEPDLFARTRTVLGSKDYINLILTGTVATDYSYASGSGVYDLQNWKYSDRLLTASGLPRDLFPDILPSAEVIGQVLPEIAEGLGLPAGISVVCGGVDNACMALGANCTSEGDAYNSLGSSSWIAVASARPVLQAEKRPYVFAHAAPGMFVSATAIFAAGSSYRWFHEQMAPDCTYAALDEMAKSVSVGCDGLLFNPTLAGGSSIDKSPNTCGAFVGLTLAHGRGHLARAVLEGVALGLGRALDVLKSETDIGPEILIVGGGSKSDLWCEILADCFGHSVVKSRVDEQAAALGAAALAFVGSGLWADFSPLAALHAPQATNRPDPDNLRRYNAMAHRFNAVSDFLSEDGDAQAGRTPA